MSDIEKELARVVERFGSDEPGAYGHAVALAEIFILRNHAALTSALADQRRYRFIADDHCASWEGDLDARIAAAESTKEN